MTYAMPHALRAYELLDVPLAFSQMHLLTDDGFVRAARDRGIDLAHGRLEALHRAGVLRPLFGVDYSARVTRAERHRWSAGGLNPNLTLVGQSASDLAEYRDAGRLQMNPDYQPWSCSTTQRGLRYKRRTRRSCLW